jgi:hypothetical protein
LFASYIHTITGPNPGLDNKSHFHLYTRTLLVEVTATNTSLTAQMKIHFLPARTTTSKKQNSRQRQSELTEAKSHAAAVAHHRAGRGYEGRILTSSVSKPVFEKVALVGRDDEEWKSKQKQEQVQHHQPQQQMVLVQKQREVSPHEGLNWIKTGVLDPFLRLPMELHVEDRRLLYFCM